MTSYYINLNCSYRPTELKHLLINCFVPIKSLVPIQAIHMRENKLRMKFQMFIGRALFYCRLGTVYLQTWLLRALFNRTLRFKATNFNSGLEKNRWWIDLYEWQCTLCAFQKKIQHSRENHAHAHQFPTSIRDSSTSTTATHSISTQYQVVWA